MNKTVKFFRIIGYAEAISFLLLLGFAMPLKYILDMPLAVSIIGALHGGLFILYVVVAAYIVYKFKWSFLTFLAAILASVLPFGPFIYDAKIIKKASETNIY